MGAAGTGVVQEAPLEELPGADRQPIQIASGDDDRGDTRTFGVDALDDQAMAQGPPDRQADPPDERTGNRGPPEAPPEEGRREVADEVLPGPQLVRQGQPDTEVGVEVQQVPRLIPQCGSRGAE